MREEVSQKMQYDNMRKLLEHQCGQEPYSNHKRYLFKCFYHFLIFVFMFFK